MSKNKWGKITVESYRDKLRIRVPSSLIGKAKYIYSGLEDVSENRFIVDTTIKQMEFDLRLEQYNEGCFDLSLAKYQFKKPKVREKAKEEEVVITLLEIWERYTDYKANFLSASTIKRDYTTITKRIFKHDIELGSLKSIEDTLLKAYSSETTRRTIQALNACLNWAVDRELLKENVLHNKKRIPKKENLTHRKHFHSDEVREIIKAFEEGSCSKYYVPLIKFLFFTGCRLEDAVALTWDKVSEKNILFNVSRPCDTKILGNTKTKEVRELPISNKVREVLNEVKEINVPNHKNLVFPSKKGNYINTSNLGTRHWKVIISKLIQEGRVKIELSCNHTRHTFINHCLNNGVSINQVAYWVGNSPKTIINNYASVIKEEPLPELYKE